MIRILYIYSIFLLRRFAQVDDDLGSLDAPMEGTAQIQDDSLQPGSIKGSESLVDLLGGRFLSRQQGGVRSSHMNSAVHVVTSDLSDNQSIRPT